MIDGRSCSIVAERGVSDLVEQTIDTSRILSTGRGGTLGTLEDGGGGILAGEEDRDGRCFGGVNGWRDGLTGELDGRISRSSRLVPSGKLRDGDQCSAYNKERGVSEH